MKKILLALSLFGTLALNKANAQIVNAGFENWTNDTTFFDGFSGNLDTNTVFYSDPAQWTTTNALTGADALGHFFFVTQTNVAHTGNSAVQLTTDTLKTVTTPLGPRRLTIPGLALNGDFPLDLQGSVLTGGVISPDRIPGAGQPFSQRLSAIKGFYSYVPVFNDSLGHVDSCTIWAVLKGGGNVVASARFTSGANTGGYVAFSAPFNYVSCTQPDTLVILLAASVPDLGSIITGYTKLVAGSILRVDDLDYDMVSGGFNFPPIANLDRDTTTKNVAKTINVKGNDEDCNDAVGSLTVTLLGQPQHGTTALQGNNIVYTPTNNYVGLDTFTYNLSDGNSTVPGGVKMVVLNSTGINDVAQVPVTIYPVPASNQLNIQFDNKGKSTLRVFDMLGNVVLTSVMTNSNNSISLENLSSGVYGIQILNDQNEVIARNKFTVSK
jgi:hypothetical protein